MGVREERRDRKIRREGEGRGERTRGREIKWERGEGI